MSTASLNNAKSTFAQTIIDVLAPGGSTGSNRLIAHVLDGLFVMQGAVVKYDSNTGLGLDVDVGVGSAVRTLSLMLPGGSVGRRLDVVEAEMTSAAEHLIALTPRRQLSVPSSPSPPPPPAPPCQSTDSSLTVDQVASALRNAYSQLTQMAAAVAPFSRTVTLPTSLAPTGFVDGISGDATVGLSTAGAFTLAFAASASFAGITVSGDLELSTDSSVISGTLVGPGTLPASACAGCPALIGDLTLTKPSVGASTFSMAASASFAAVTVSGNVVLSSQALVSSFTLTSSAQQTPTTACVVCPPLSGTLTVGYTLSATPPLSASVQVDTTFAGINVVGTATLHPTFSFSLSGDANAIKSNICCGSTSAISRIVGGGSIFRTTIAQMSSVFQFDGNLVITGDATSATISLPIKLGYPTANLARTISFSVTSQISTASDLVDAIVSKSAEVITQIKPLDITVPLSSSLTSISGGRKCLSIPTSYSCTWTNSLGRRLELQETNSTEATKQANVFG